MQHLYSNKEVVISRYKKATYCLKRHSTEVLHRYHIYLRHLRCFRSLEIRVQLHFIHIIYFTKINRSAYLSSILGAGGGGGVGGWGASNGNEYQFANTYANTYEYINLRNSSSLCMPTRIFCE